MASVLKLCAHRAETESVDTIFPSADKYYTTGGKKYSHSRKIFSRVKSLSSETKSSSSDKRETKSSSSSDSCDITTKSSSDSSSSDSCDITTKDRPSSSSSEDSCDTSKTSSYNFKLSQFTTPESTQESKWEAPTFFKKPDLSTKVIKLLRPQNEGDLKGRSVLVVDPNLGNDTNPNPSFRTIGAAVSRATNYETIQLLPGIYPSLPIKGGLTYQALGKVRVDGLYEPVKDGLGSKIIGITFNFPASATIINPSNFYNCHFEIASEIKIYAIVEFDHCSFKWNSSQTISTNLIQAENGTLNCSNSKFYITNGSGSDITIFYIAPNSHLVTLNNQFFIKDKGGSKYTWIGGSGSGNRQIAAHGNMIMGVNEHPQSKSTFILSSVIPIKSGNGIKLNPEWSWNHMEIIVYEPKTSRIRMVNSNTQIQPNDYRIVINTNTPVILTLPPINSRGELSQELEIIAPFGGNHKVIPSLGNKINGDRTNMLISGSLKFQPCNGYWIAW